MQEWSLYVSADDFLSDPAFREWVRSGQFEQPDHPFTIWFGQHAHQMPLARQAADYLLATAITEAPVSPDQVDAVVTATWQRIRTSQTDLSRQSPTGGRANAPVRPLWSPTTWLWRAAAVLLMVGFAGWLLRDQLPFHQLAATPSREIAPAGDSPAWTRQTNRTATPQFISLSDGSTVWLAPKSTLRHPITFGPDRREVELAGEAFFEVAKDADKPFFVRTNALVTRVVGTSFLVRSYDQDPQAMVQVRTGRVMVYRTSSLKTASSKAPAIVLRANQQVILPTKEQSANPVALPVSRPTDLAVRLNQQAFDFADAPVADVFSAFATTYAVRIDYDPVLFRNCRITTALSDEPLTEKLSILAETIGPGTRYEVEGNRIRFTGRGCQ